MIASPTSGVCDTALDLREILHKSPVRVYIGQGGSSWFGEDGFGDTLVAIGVAVSCVRRLPQSVLCVQRFLHWILPFQVDFGAVL